MMTRCVVGHFLHLVHGGPLDVSGEGEAETKGQRRSQLEALPANHTLCPLVLGSLSD